MELQIHQLNRKNVHFALKNDHQDREIRLLKTLMSKILDNENKDDEIKVNHDVLMVQKRPARLLPLHLLFRYKSFIFIFNK